MENKKVYIVLIVFLFVFFFVMFISFGVPNLKKDKLKAILIVGNHSIWNYANQRWNSITNPSEMKELNWQKYHLFAQYENKGRYSLWYDDNEWYAFDEEKNSYSLGSPFFAYTSNYDITVYPYHEEKVTDTKYIANVLKNHNISLSSKLTTSTKISLDFDQDGIKEEFYAVSNAFSLEEEPSVVFSFAFMVKENAIYMIYEDVRENDYFGACKPFYTGFLDIDRDNVSELVLSCGHYSVENQTDSLYQFTNQMFKKVISNE